MTTAPNPTGWPGRLFGAACLLLLAAVAVNLAVELLRSVWPWLVGLLAIAAGIVAMTRLAIWWQRRRLW